MSEYREAVEFVAFLERSMKGFEKVKSLVALLGEGEGVLAAQRKKIADGETELASLAPRLEVSRAKLDKARKDTEDAIASLNADLAERRRASAEEIRGIREGMEKAVAEASAVAAAGREELNGLNAELSSARSELAFLQTEIATLKKKFA